MTVTLVQKCSVLKCSYHHHHHHESIDRDGQLGHTSGGFGHHFSPLGPGLIWVEEVVKRQACPVLNVILVWPTSWTPAVGGLIVCVCPKTCRHIARRMMNGWLWNFACTCMHSCQLLRFWRSSYAFQPWLRCYACHEYATTLARTVLKNWPRQTNFVICNR